MLNKIEKPNTGRIYRRTACSITFIGSLLCFCEYGVAAEQLRIKNQLSETVRVWIWNFSSRRWVYDRSIVLRPTYTVPIGLKPGKYRLVFQNKDNVRIDRDLQVTIMQGRSVYLVTTPAMVNEVRPVIRNGKEEMVTISKTVFKVEQLTEYNVPPFQAMP